MSQKVFVVQTIDDAKALLAYVEKSRADTSAMTIVSLDPSARAHLVREGVPCLDTLLFFDNASHARALRGTNRFQHLIQQNLALDLADGLQRTYSNRFVFYALFFLRHAITVIEVLDGIVRVFPQCTALACCASPANPVLSELCTSFCRSRGLALELLDPLPSDGRISARQGAARLGQHRVLLQNLMLWFTTRCYRLVLARAARTRSVLLASAGAKMVAIADSLRDAFPNLAMAYCRHESFSVKQEMLRAVFWLAASLWGRQAQGKLLTIPVQQIGAYLGHRDRLAIRRVIESSITGFLDRSASQLEYAGLSCDVVIKSYKEHLVDLIQRHHDLGLAQALLLDLLRPAMVVSPSGGQEYHLLGELCGQRGIPAVLIPMKSLTPPQGELEQMGELEIGDDMLTEVYPVVVAQSQQAMEYARHARYGGRIIPSGPLLRTRVTAAQRTAGRARFFKVRSEVDHIVAYAPSMKPHSVFHVTESLDEVLNSMQDIVEAVQQLPRTHLILRLHPNLAYLQRDLPQLLDLTPNVVVDAGSYDSIDSVLAVADVMVTNMSTVAEEAVHNRIPVILYDKWARYNHLKAPQVVGGCPDELSPAYYVAAQGRLACTLRWILENHPVGLDFPAAVMDRYAYADGETQAFYDFVAQTLGCARV